ncbi:SpoIIE family protein phosphatase [Nonomuraea maritima]|uniref:SpoIIE family protein phosphatase n=1 Tax=Nonomuraea maritima TaxID=683260 RepID=UPI00371AC179
MGQNATCHPASEPGRHRRKKGAADEASGAPPPDGLAPAPVGIAITSGRDHRVVYATVAFQHAAGTPNLPLRRLLGRLRRDHADLLDQVLDSGRPLRMPNLALRPQRRGAATDRRRVSLQLSRLQLASGGEGLLVVAVETVSAAGAPAPSGDYAQDRRRLLRHYHSLMQDEARVVWVMSPLGHVVESSDTWEELTGQRRGEYLGAGWLRAVHPDDRTGLRGSWRRSGTPSRWEHVFRLRTAGGDYRHVRARAIPVSERATATEWIGTCADIEEEWQAGRRRKLLDRAAAATADIAGLDEVLRLLTKVIVPTVLDGCGVYLVPEITGAPTEPFSAQRLVSIVRQDLRPEPQPGCVRFPPDCGFVRAVTTRRTVHEVFPPGQPPPALAPPGAEDWFRMVGANSAALIPVIVDGAVAAVLDAVVCGPKDPISEADVELLVRMLDHAHTHLSNAMRFQRTQRVALALQECLLPDPPDVPGLEITARYRASAAAVEIGGDWYDSFVLPDGTTVLTIGDVAGHDLAAAVTMSQLRNMLRGLAMDRREPPGDILRRLNIATESLYADGTATCVLARLAPGPGGGWQLDYSVAGHPPPLLVTPDGTARYLRGALNPLLGVGYDRRRTSAVAQLPPRGTLLLYTDGLVELPGENIARGLDRLRRHAGALSRVPVGDLCDDLLARMPIANQDDVAMIAVRLP